MLRQPRPFFQPQLHIDVHYVGFVPYNPESGEIGFTIHFHYPDFRLSRSALEAWQRRLPLHSSRADLIRGLTPPANAAFGPCREELGSGLEWIILSDFGSQSLTDGIASLMGKVFIGRNSESPKSSDVVLE